jgi:hypothetical protein
MLAKATQIKDDCFQQLINNKNSDKIISFRKHHAMEDFNGSGWYMSPLSYSTNSYSPNEFQINCFLRTSPNNMFLITEC